MLTFFNGLFINSLLIISSITFANMLIREKFLEKIAKKSLINGFMAGLLGCLLMLYSIKVTPEILLDFRLIPIILMGLYVSLSASIESAIIIGTFRIVYYGISLASGMGFIVALLSGVIAGLIGKMKGKIQIKWALSISLVCVVVGIAYTCLLNDPSLLRDVIVAHTISMSIASLLMYYFVNYIQAFNAQYKKIREAATKDFLTGLHNVRYFDETFNSYISEAKIQNKSVSLLFIDIDLFKRVNDIHGHINGDLVLKEIGTILLSHARNNDTVTRKGGEEFTVLLFDCSLEQAMTVAERIRIAIKEHEFSTDKHQLMEITVSIGVSSYPETTSDEELMEKADIALYRAKRSGRDRVEIA